MYRSSFVPLSRLSLFIHFGLVSFHLRSSIAPIQPWPRKPSQQPERPFWAIELCFCLFRRCQRRAAPLAITYRVASQGIHTHPRYMHTPPAPLTPKRCTLDFLVCLFFGY
ncbi:hypothetical protein M407DRAFT_203579 [Tulasnella calospora MUT 4182]|uniref:Secreted protein n=1 Tax=Tulasnella calospora MUT 4182 TaxID=1051891 RepID=A0A0C3Q8I9_9AGAM|nr:hypothetical protein M407DRAFT_203579 [Tulasnella calospora MUT 4182]